MKKYRTKSGMVEEKLPGVNATVNPSEKTQIAMAGGANTLKDVQTILGQEGKRNNLKGQGAKHLVSFGHGDDDDTIGQQVGPADGTSNIGGLDVSGGMAESVMGLGLSFGEPDGGDTLPAGIRGAAELTDKDLAAIVGKPLTQDPKTGDYIGRSKSVMAEVSRRGSVIYADPDEKFKAKPSPLDAPRFKAPKYPTPEHIPLPAQGIKISKEPAPPELGKPIAKPDIDTSITDKLGLTDKDVSSLKTGANIVTTTKGLIDATKMGAYAGPYAAVALIGGILTHVLNKDPDPAIHGGQRMNETVEQFETRKAGLEKAAETEAAYQAQPTKMNPKTPWTPPDDPIEGSPKKKELIRSAANNVTLPISEKKDKRSLRDIMRGQGGWRFA
jgi:hypothetical protein